MTRILLIKLGALGDVLRTTCLLPGIRKHWPDARVTWVSAESARPLLERNAGILEFLSMESIRADRPAARLDSSAWDVLINLDEDPAATALAAAVPAKRKVGVGRDASGRLIPLAPESEYLIQLAGDDRLKFRENQFPFQALIYHAVGLKWAGESYDYTPPPDLADRQRKLFSASGPAESISGGGPARVGLFVGASQRYANKFWSEEEIIRFCQRWREDFPDAAARPGLPSLVLLGGPGEVERIRRFREHPVGRQIPAVCVDTLDDLAGVIAACRLLICGDTLAMHLGAALQVPLIVLFGPTSPAEILVAGRKIISPYSCGPCYLRVCGIRPSCMTVIEPSRVIRAVREILN